METVTFKIQSRILKKLDRLLHPLNFNSRTEFIREAIREKLNRIETELFMSKLSRFKGSAEVSVDDEELERIRDEVARRYAKKMSVKLN